jgi:hypothetical protein
MTATDDAASGTRTSSEMPLARIPPTPTVELQALVGRAAVVALGAASLVATVVANALARSFDTEEAGLEGRGGRPPVPEPPARLAGALLGLAVEATRWSSRAAPPIARRFGQVLSIAGDLPPVRRAGSRLEDVVQRLDTSWGDGRPQREEAASSFIKSLMTEVVDATLDQIDLTSLALERIDMERILDRVDVDELAARVDLAAMLERLDLAKIAEEVIEELDVGELIRDSTGSMATETVEGIRVQGMKSDLFVSRLVDRAFGRRDNDDARNQGGNGRPRRPER